MDWLKKEKGLSFGHYHDLWSWSVEELEAFWESIWDYFGVQGEKGPGPYLASRRMPGARWFPGALLNYAREALCRGRDDDPALLYKSETQPLTAITYGRLKEEVAAFRKGLEELGVTAGDRVAAYLPNRPEAVVGLLAAASLGAVWSSCSPDFGTKSVLDRFGQIEPKVLLAVEAYTYNGRLHDRREVVKQLKEALPSLEALIIVGDETLSGEKIFSFEEILSRGRGADLTFYPAEFSHPLWILYSSGTTGLPKPIVQGHGGIVLEHLKALAFHNDVGPGHRFFWYTTTGWMMWNYLVGALLLGGTAILYDGSPAYPHLGVLFELAQETKMTTFGTSAPYLHGLLKEGYEPRQRYDLSALKALGSTGAPLSPEGFAYVYEKISPDIWLASISGGTDVCTAFLGGCPLLPVYAGELQCRALGAKVEAFDEEGKPVVEEVGELVLTEPLPSMPLYFWNDPDGQRYREAYFETFPGVWRHGDWVKITRRGTAIIYGRSDATIKRHGVRMGTAEFYSVVESLPWVADSLLVDLSAEEGEAALLLFLTLREGEGLTPEREEELRQKLRKELSPRHVPDRVIAAPGVPRTLNGKKMEVPVKKLFLGVPLEKAINLGSVQNPEVLAFYQELARSWQKA